MINRITLLLTLLLTTSISYGQKLAIEKAWKRNSVHIDKAKKMKPEDVKGLMIYQYNDSLFPNQEILKYKNLKYLLISDMRRTKDKVKFGSHKPRINRSGLDKLTHLKYLKISNIDVSEIALNICELKNLELLNLDLTNLDSIPKEICNLTKLKKLSLRLNNISFLPKKIGTIDSLLVLDLANNSFKEIPNEIKEFKNINTINLGNPETSVELKSNKHNPFGAHINSIDYIKEYKLIEEIISIKNVKHFYTPFISCNDNENLKRLIRNDNLEKKLGIRGLTPCSW